MDRITAARVFVETVERGSVSRAAEHLDIRQEMLDAATALAHPGPASKGSMTSDLSIDEELTLHSVGWDRSSDRSVGNLAR